MKVSTLKAQPIVSDRRFGALLEYLGYQSTNHPRGFIYQRIAEIFCACGVSGNAHQRRRRDRYLRRLLRHSYCACEMNCAPDYPDDFKNELPIA